MADYNSSLPIRTENAGDAIVKIADATTPAQQLAVNVDGSINAVVTATNLDIRDLVFATDKVDVSGSSVTVSATDLDIRNLSASQDNVAISDGTDTLAVNADGSINSVVTATNLDIRDLAFATDKVDVSGSSVTVSATDLDIRNLSASQDNVAISDGTDTLAVNADGSINVVVTDSTPGTPLNNYNTAASVAGGATNNHDYTSTGNFYLTQIEASGSGKMKIEVLVNGTTRFVQFNSTSEPNMSIMLTQPILATTGQVVRIIRTNRENQAQDLYSTISGYTI